MATLQQLQDALVKANDAGDDANAQLFADEIKKMQANAGPSPDQQVLDNYNKLPWYQKPLQAGDDVMRMLADGATFGNADKAAAKMNSWLGGTKYDDELVKERQSTHDAETRAGLASIPAELMGGVLTGETAAKAGLTLGGRFYNAATPLLGRLGMSAATTAAEGAGYGALSAQGHDQNVLEGAKSGAELGALLGPAVEGVQSGLGKFSTWLSGVNASPSVAALNAAKDAAYQQMERSGARYSPQAMQDMMTDMIGGIVRNPAGARQATAPKALDKITQIADTATPRLPGTRQRAGAPVSMYDLDELRKSVVRDVMDSSNAGAEQHWGGAIRDTMDRTMADTDPSKITASIGTPQEAHDALMNARELNRRAGNVDDMQKILTDAQRRADVSSAGAGPGDRIRGRLASVLESDKKSRFLNDSERSHIEDVISGTTTGNLARNLGAFMNSWAGRGAASSVGATAGGMLGGPLGAGAGAATGFMGSQVVKKIADAIAEKSTEGGVRDVMASMARGRRTIPYRANAPLNDQQAQDMLRRLLILQAQHQSSQSN